MKNLPMKMDQTECSETSAHKIQTPGNYPEENIQRTKNSLVVWSREKIVSIVTGCAQDDQGILAALWAGARY
jgi:hypothetical protein